MSGAFESIWKPATESICTLPPALKRKRYSPASVFEMVNVLYRVSSSVVRSATFTHLMSPYLARSTTNVLSVSSLLIKELSASAPPFLAEKESVSPS